MLVRVIKTVDETDRLAEIEDSGWFHSDSFGFIDT